MKIVFMGTPDFAVYSLKELINSNHSIAAVFTQPDKPSGRGYGITAPPVKKLAMEHNIPVFQPASLKGQEVYTLLSELNPDLIAVVAYGKILPENILNLPKYGCINLHASLLPKYRGAAPIQWAIINGETKTGLTTMKMDAGLDTGDILLSEAVDIHPDETFGQLHDRMAGIGAKILLKTIDSIEDIKPIPQNDEESSYAKLIDKQTAVIDWQNDACRINNLIRGLSPYPAARTLSNGKIIKIFSARPVDTGRGLECGAVFSDNNRCLVQCGQDTALELLEVQQEGSKRMSINNFLRGNKSFVSSVLGREIG